LLGAALSWNLLSLGRRRHSRKDRALLLYDAYYTQSFKR
jgi:hypothetical protein